MVRSTKPYRERYMTIPRADKHRCYYCCGLLQPGYTQLDHIVPIGLGGPDVPMNRVETCMDCNSHKKALPMLDFVVLNACDVVAAGSILWPGLRYARFAGVLDGISRTSAVRRKAH